MYIWYISGGNGIGTPAPPYHNAKDLRMTGKSLIEIAFEGHSIFLLECALAVDFTRDKPLPKRIEPVRFVYFIGLRNGPIKIGVANKPYNRLSELQIAHHEDLYLFAMTAGNMDTEKALHVEFREDNLRGEWFHASDRLLRRIISIQEQEREIYAEFTTRQATEPTHRERTSIL